AAVAISAAVIGEPLGWTLPLAVLAGLAAAFAVQRHAVRRLGGITGDVLGALAEIATTVTLVVAAMGPVASPARPGAADTRSIQPATRADRVRRRRRRGDAERAAARGRWVGRGHRP